MFPFFTHRKGKFFLPLITILLFTSFSYSEHPEEKYRKIQKKILEHKNKIKEVQEREHSILKDIEDVNKKLAKIEKELRKLKKKLSQTESEIAAVNEEIGKTKVSLEKQKDWINRKLRVMHKFGYSGDTLMLLLNADDISQMMRIWRYLENITRYEHKILGDYQKNLRNLDEKSKKLNVLKTELLANKKEIKTKERALEKEKNSKRIILTGVRYKKASHQKMLSELKEASKKLLKIIKEASKSDAYAKSTFRRLKGKFSWPANGKIAIPYGTQKDPHFNTPVFRNGIHIRSNYKADVKSIYKGKVIFAEWFKGFGQLVIINHGGGYHSLYGNLSEIFSNAGDIIKESQVIGKVGTSGILNAPGLYFEIRYKGKPLEPTQWLKNK